MQTRLPLRVTCGVPLVLAAVLLAGCAEQPATDEASSRGSAASTSPAEDEAAATSAAAEPAAETSEFPADAAAVSAAPVDPAGLSVTEVRAGRHEGYDRVVFELSGTGTPGWQVEYVDTPSSQGSGDVVEVPGEAALQVVLQGTSYPYETGAEEVARGEVAVAGTENVAGVVYDATYEGTSVAWIGTPDRRPFRVYALTGPSRVVVEVADAG
ncbi:hypothetical protein [uncultured Modestobacter sp.]|uniref:AMIN-like domain-containing (lipo)protein n=1 Tax=uncultured Modestobacter sp. TaxID=380048 RepID=UPI002611C3D8|nr:hypothetical protein [uncultured Modestobacter sp.]